MQNADASLPEPLQAEPNHSNGGCNLAKARASRGNRPRHATELQQATAIRDVAHTLTIQIGLDIASAPDAASRKAIAISLRMAVAAWEIACDRVRIARGKPLPGSLRPEPLAKRKQPKQPANSFSETPDATPAGETSSPKESLSGQ